MAKSSPVTNKLRMENWEWGMTKNKPNRMNSQFSILNSQFSILALIAEDLEGFIEDRSNASLKRSAWLAVSSSSVQAKLGLTSWWERECDVGLATIPSSF
ncbi:MAG: hypothetical protein ACOVQH_07815, partial [Burkholderiaceae bacterium]